MASYPSLCRLYFNTKQKYLGIIGEDKKEQRIPIQNLNDIFCHSELLLETAGCYENIQIWMLYIDIESDIYLFDCVLRNMKQAI